MSVLVIAEAGVNHNGSLETAKRLVDMAKECGADVIKFQTFKAYESTGVYAEKAQYQKENTESVESQYEMIKQLELPFEDFKILQLYCNEKGIIFASTPDGIESLDYLIELEVPFIKVGSTEVSNLKFLEKIAQSGKEIILSTGMSYLSEVDVAVRTIIKTGNNKIKLMQCTTDYPTKLEDVNLRAMVTMREAFHLPVGFSDHTEGCEAAVAAVALGAEFIEKHITLDKNMEGPDHKASMDKIEFKNYIQSIRNTEMLLGDGIKRPTERELIIEKDVRRSIVAARNLENGTVLTEDMLDCKRPGYGLDPSMMKYVIGRTIGRSVRKDELIQWKDL